MTLRATAGYNGSSVAITGGTITNVSNVNGVFNVKGFGAKGDGVTDDTAAINAALTAASVQTSGISASSRVIVPPGVYVISSGITIPNNVILGNNSGDRTAQIIAGTGFPVSTAMFDLGGGLSVYACRIEGLTINANNIAGSVCLTTSSAQDQCGYVDCMFENYTKTGFQITGGSGQNIVGHRGEFRPSASGSTYGVDLSGVGSINMQNNTFIATAGSHSAAINWNGAATIIGVHVEGFNIGVVTSGTGSLFEISGPTNANAVTYLIHNFNVNQSFSIYGITKNNAAYAYFDTVTGYTSSASYVSKYCPHIEVVGGKDFSPNPVAGAAASVTIDASLYTYNYTSTAINQAFTVNAPLNPVQGRSLTMELLQDATGGRAVTWASVFKGVTLAASGTANQKAIISFISDGTKWYQSSSSGWQT